MVGRLWEHVRAKHYYSDQGCLSCGMQSRAPDLSHRARRKAAREGDTDVLRWRIIHLPGCTVPLLQATEEIAVRTVVQWFAARKLSPIDELPLATAMISKEFENMPVHTPLTNAAS